MKLGVADPGMVHGGSSSATNANKIRPHIIGVLRRVRIWNSPYLGQTDYITDSENSSWYSSSEGESCIQEEAEYFFSMRKNNEKQPGP